jgi:flagellar basal-body rod modification protein FlgD
MAVNSIASTAATAAASNSALTGFAKNFDSFLTLLTAQLKYQDPLSPMDATQFTTQLVQFTGVEQAIHQNESLETLISLQKDAGVGSAVGYIGKTVTANGNSISLSGGSATVSYTLAGPAASTTISILDSQGKVIKTLTGDKTVGAHTVAWDGRGDDNVLRPDGAYTVRVSAKDSNDNPVSVTTGTTGVVTKVALNNGKVTLTVGSNLIPLSDVVSVSATPTT